MTTSQRFYQQLGEVLAQEPAVVATIVKVVGSAPREVGAKMAVYGEGSILGTIGGGAGEGKVIEQALIALKKRKEAKNRLIEIDLTGAPNKDTQGICGGKVQVWLEVWAGKRAIALTANILEVFRTGQSTALVTCLAGDLSPHLVNEQSIEKYTHSTAHIENGHFVEIIQPPPALLIVGGGHVAVALAQSAHFAGFQIAVQDDRPSFVTSDRFPQATFLSHSISDVLTHFTVHSQLYVALVARGFPQDIEALKTLLQRPVAYKYIGAIGSRKRIRRVCQAMEKQGIPLERLSNFHAPIGLDIGALTPEEIAISICAELIKVHRGGTGRSLCERVQSSEFSSKVHIGERHYAHPLP